MLRTLLTKRLGLLNKQKTPNPLHQKWQQKSPFSLHQTTRQSKTFGPRLLDRIPYSRETWYTLKYGTGIILAFHIFVEYFFAVHATYGASMLPTLNAIGDFVCISKYYRHGRGVQVGDLVSYVHPVREDVSAIKRVLGMPGDFVLRDTPGRGDGIMIQVPRGHCWVVGDNLPASRDSRLYGPVPLGLIRGKVTWVWRDWLSLPERLHNTMQDVDDSY